MIIFDIIKNREYIGGPALNVSLHMSMGGHTPVLVSAVGRDKLGGIAKRILAENNVSTEYIRTDPDHETGRVCVTLDKNGTPEFDIKRKVAYDYITLTGRQIAALARNTFDVLYFGTVVQRSCVTADTLRTILGKVPCRFRFYDINLREGHYERETIDFSLLHTDIFKLNEHEVFALVRIFDLKLNREEEIIAWVFAQYSVQIVVVTKGEGGVSVYTPDGRKDIAAIKVKVKDTVGAGDGFSAGFIMDYLKNEDVVHAAEKGNELGAYVASRTGAVL